MSDQVLGAVAAIAAAALYSAAVTLQAIEARRVPASHALRVSLLGRLLQRPLWLLGAATGILAWCLQAVALGYAALTLVEPILALTLVFLLVESAIALQEHVGRRDVLAVVAVAAGVAGVGAAAPPHSGSHAGAPELVTVLGCLMLGVAAPHVLHANRITGSLVAASAGIAYALVALGTKLAADDLAAGDHRGAAGWLLFVAALGAAGVLSEMSALQSWPVTQVAPIVFGLNVLVPVLLAPVVAGEAWSRGDQLMLPAALVLLSLGLITVARSTAVTAALTAEATAAEELTGNPALPNESEFLQSP